nr:PD-(D/E)XK motif protein [uncultured Lachnoclostridium sp.]
MKTSEIKNRWQELRGAKGFLQRVDPNHPMDFFIGISERGNEELVLITKLEPVQLKSSKALDVEKNIRNDGRWATQISSLEKQNQDVFSSLCWDLIESSRNILSEKEGLELLTKRYILWQKLFVSIHNDLSDSVLKGMIGELQFAKEKLAKKNGWDVVMSAWQGPDGADRDFVLNEKWYEIKAIATGKEKIRISSLNQLETDYDGVLVVYKVDRSSNTDLNALSVSSYVNSLRDKMKHYPSVLQLFEQKLISLGYIDKKSYDEIYFTCSGPEYYCVDKEFPKLITGNVPLGIVSVQYDLSLAGINAWKMEEKEVWG